MRDVVRKCVKALKLIGASKWRVGLMHGVGAAIEHKGFLKGLDCQFVVDVGANCGQFTLAARVLCDTAKIHSFEPLSEPAETFKTLFDSDDCVTLHQVALGVTREKKIMHISKSIDSSSLFPISDLQEELFPGTSEVGETSVTVVPLHELLQPNEIVKPALLKIDVQGYELEVLRGCDDMLSNFAHVYVECSFVELYEGQPLARDIIDFLQQRNFFMRGVYNMSYDRLGHAVQADFHFSNSENMDASY